MVTQRNSNKIFVPSLAAAAFALAVYTHVNFPAPLITKDRQESALNFNRNFLSSVSTGNQRLISSVLWIQTLLESDQEQYHKQDLGSWMYLRFLTIAKLDPKFYENYLFGGIYLSIVKDDLTGAADIFERGLQIYPTDYKLNYHAGFNYYFEQGNFKKGLEKLSLIEFDPKLPKPLRFIINKLKFEETGNTELTINFLLASLKSETDETIREKIKRDIYSLKATRDLKCLNAGESGCEMVDAFGAPYTQTSSGKWSSKMTFEPFKIYRKKNESQRDR
jgi:tetratricopeptide (TPR) repeat protein